MIGFFSNKDSLKAKLFRKSNLSTALVNLDHTSNTLPPRCTLLNYLLLINARHWHTVYSNAGIISNRVIPWTL